MRAFTRDKEFDFTNWVWNAMQVKLAQRTIAAERYLTEEERHNLVVDFLKVVLEIQIKEGQPNQILLTPISPTRKLPRQSCALS